MISPKAALAINAVYLTLSGITAVGLQQAGIANAVQVAAIAGIIATALNGVLHAYSSPDAGPLTK